MSELAMRSAVVLALLFGLVFAVGAGAMTYYDLPLQYALLFTLVVVGLQYLAGPYILQFTFKVGWVQPEEVSPRFAAWLREACQRNRIPVPRFGVIPDGNPTAFTFGHVPADARLVVSQGLIDCLEPEELEAVVAHELGHIINWDFVTMTVAQCVPLLLYMVYSFTTSDRRKGDSAYAWLVGVGAYGAYILSQFIVLLLSRVREYFADNRSAHITHDPNALATALVKIAYGLARPVAEDPEAKDKGKKPELGLARRAGALGIADARQSTAFAIAASSPSGFSPDLMARAMQWDLRNPWARFYEVLSTHPLTARRIHALSGLCRMVGQEPTVPMPRTGAQYNLWPAVRRDVLIAALPWLGALIGSGFAVQSILHFESLALSALGNLLLGFGVGWLARLVLSYPNDHTPAKVEDLVTQVDVSHIHAIPVVMEGLIIGRGVPGCWFSEDLVLQDDGGFVTLDYRQPLGILDLLQGLFGAKKLLGKRVRVHGWFRRGPNPVVEVLVIRSEDGQVVHCYYQVFLKALSGLAIVAGALMTLLAR
ncbi:MAG TPA: M48 family metalloprotease [Armatimonadota bacterium]|jgi:heat shock protein HtpX